MKRKTLSADGMISILGKSFTKIIDPRGDRIKIQLKDALLTAYAAFSLKHESFNSFFDELDRDETKRTSVKNLFKVQTEPSATRLKEIIDPVDTHKIMPAFGDIFREIQRGKVLEKFLFLDKYYLLALAGVSYL